MSRGPCAHNLYLHICGAGSKFSRFINLWVLCPISSYRWTGPGQQQWIPVRVGSEWLQFINCSVTWWKSCPIMRQRLWHLSISIHSNSIHRKSQLNLTTNLYDYPLTDSYRLMTQTQNEYFTQMPTWVLLRMFLWLSLIMEGNWDI